MSKEMSVEVGSDGTSLTILTVRVIQVSVELTNGLMKSLGRPLTGRLEVTARPILAPLRRGYIRRHLRV